VRRILLAPVAVALVLASLAGGCADARHEASPAAGIHLSAFPEPGGAFLTWYAVDAAGPYEVEQQAQDGTSWRVVAVRAATTASIGGLRDGESHAFRVRERGGGDGAESAVVRVTPRERGRCSYPSFHPLFPRLSFFCTFDDFARNLAQRGIAPSSLRCRGRAVEKLDRDLPDCAYTAGDELLLLSRAADRVPAYQEPLAPEVVRDLARRLVWGEDDPYRTPAAHPYAVEPASGFGTGEVVGFATTSDQRIVYAGGRFTSRVTRFTPPDPVPGRLAIFHEGHDATARVAGADVVSWLLARRWTVVAMDLPMVGLNAPDAVAPVVDHNELWRLDDGTTSPIAHFVLPVKAVLDGFTTEHPGDDRTVLMVGRSGGAWTTYVSGAIDPRVDLAVAVAGGSPVSQRLLDVLEAWELGDYEQFFPQLYDVVGHENLIAAAGRRALFVAYAPRDPCCYRLGTDDPFFPWLVAAGAASGKPVAVAVDPEHRRHGLSADQLAALDRFLEEHAPLPRRSVGIPLPG